MAKSIQLIFSCEHGGNKIPSAYQLLFAGQEELLNSHQGWDPGALMMAKILSDQLSAPLYYSDISRLLIEQNRTLQHPQLFSSISKNLSETEKASLISAIYIPYVENLEKHIQQAILEGSQVIHLSIHSFTPVLNGVKREAEIGLLFDPTKEVEAKYAQQWKSSIEGKYPDWRVKYNYPYLGTDDGLTQYFREKYPHLYAGLELEINHALFFHETTEKLCATLLPPIDLNFDENIRHA